MGTQIVEKAQIETTFGELYARLCVYLDEAAPDFQGSLSQHGQQKRTMFGRCLLAACQMEFEKGIALEADVLQSSTEDSLQKVCFTFGYFHAVCLAVLLCVAFLHVHQPQIIRNSSC